VSISEEIRASAAAHRDLGPGYDKAVAEGLVERIGEEIDRRVDARLGSQFRDTAPRRRPRDPGQLSSAHVVLALGSMGLATGVTAGLMGPPHAQDHMGFLVALIWCRPWLLDPSATTPLPRTPEIARGALEVTGAYHELERFETDAEFRDLLSARVAEHIKVLRRKISDRGLAGPGVRLSDEVAVRLLIEHGIITSADLTKLADPVWRSRQEDLWWTEA